jgi:hypothetical protein
LWGSFVVHEVMRKFCFFSQADKNLW